MTSDELKRRLILDGNGWHDEDGPTIVDRIDPDGDYPVHYHWASGGAGAASIDGFIRDNYLPVEEMVRVASTAAPPPVGTALDPVTCILTVACEAHDAGRGEPCIDYNDGETDNRGYCDARIRRALVTP